MQTKRLHPGKEISCCRILKPNLDKDGKVNKSIGHNGRITNTNTNNDH